MRFAITISTAAVVISAGFAFADAGKYTVKKIKVDAPDKLAPHIRTLLANEAIQFSEKGGKVLANIWLAKSIPGNVKAKEGKTLKYADLPQSSVLGAVYFPKGWRDYRKQKLPAGVYTLRFATQPQDGDHMGTAPHPSFVVLVSAKLDAKKKVYRPKELAEYSAVSINTTHPAVFLLFPNSKAKSEPSLVAPMNEHIMLSAIGNVTANGKKTSLPIGLNLVGHADE